MVLLLTWFKLALFSDHYSALSFVARACSLHSVDCSSIQILGICVLVQILEAILKETACLSD